MEKVQLVHEFEKNPQERVRLEVGEFLGKDMISVRVYYSLDNEGNEWRPTKRGITMNALLISELKKAVDKAYQMFSGKLLEEKDSSQN